jgi:hypothetical protein
MWRRIIGPWLSSNSDGSGSLSVTSFAWRAVERTVREQVADPHGLRVVEYALFCGFHSDAPKVCLNGPAHDLQAMPSFDHIEFV